MAFKASPSSQHQHCTDEAQDACLTLLRSVLVSVTDTFSFVFAVMPFARSVVLHFPAEIHRAQGVSEVAPQLLQALDVEKIAAVQFLKNGQVRVTCKTAEYRDDLLEGSTFLFGDVPIPVTAADQPIRSVFVRDLPFEVPDCDVKSAFESFGVVLSVHQCFFRDFPSVANGTRRLVMSFRGSIPSSVSVAFPCTCVSCWSTCRLFHLSRIRASASRLPFFGAVPALQAARSHGPSLYTALGSVQFQFQFQSSCVYFFCVCFLCSVCTVLRAVFVVICTRFHYPVYACAIRSVISYCPVHFCVCSCAICPVS